MSAKITYRLSAAGQKASLLAGGNGKRGQMLTVERDDPLFTRCVAAGSIDNSGSVKIEVYTYRQDFDAPQTAADILSWLDGAAARAAEKEATDKRKVTEDTLAVLRERKVRRHRAPCCIGEDGCCGGATVEYDTADWPYYADSDVKASPEAEAWLAELHAAEVAARAAAEVVARAELAEKKIAAAAQAVKDAEAAERLAAAKLAMGGLATDYRCRIEDGAIQNIPLKRGDKSWFARIAVSVSSPGGLARDFAPKARGAGNYYQVSVLSPGDPVEFGEDTVSRRGRRTTDRWYGFVVAVTGDAILLRQCADGKTACKEGAKYAETHSPAAAVPDAIDAGIARVNAEGAIVPAPSAN